MRYRSYQLRLLFGLCAMAAQGSSALAQEKPAAAKPSDKAPAVLVDLSPALDSNLIVESIIDEGEPIRAENDKAFVIVPILYDPSGSDFSFYRAAMHGKDGKGFHGVRFLTAKDDKLQIEGPDGSPIFERVDFKKNNPSDADAKPSFSVRNTTGPRRPEGDKSKPVRPRAKAEAPEPTGFAALIFEIPKRAKELIFGCDAIGEVTIDLDSLRHARQPLSLQNDDASGDTAPAAITDAVQLAANGSGPTAALAIEQLARTRMNWPPANIASWLMSVDSAVLSAGGREESLVQAAAWRYFAAGFINGHASIALTQEVLDYLAMADDSLQRQWLRTIERGTHQTDGGIVWSRPMPREIKMASAQASAVAMLMAILRSEDESVCKDALGILSRMDAAEVDWSLFRKTSPQAQQLAVACLSTIKDKKAATALTNALFRAPAPAAAPKLAEAAEKIGLRIDSPDDPTLLAWESLPDAEHKTAFLAALEGVDLRPIIYSDRLFAILMPAVLESISEAPEAVSLREAAWNLVLKQIARDNPATAARKTGSNKSPRSAPDVFPLLVSHATRDPAIMVVSDAARRGPRMIRIAALTTLLQLGYADEAARDLTDAATTPQQRDLLLKELAARDDATISRDVRLALFGNLLKPDCATSAPWILDRLAELKTKTPADQQWRIAAAIKAGLNFSDLDQLAAALRPPVADQAVQWLQNLGHMSVQDAQRLAAVKNPAERATILDRIDFRRGQLVDGQYGVIAVIETISGAPKPISPSSKNYFPKWLPPRRRSLILPALTISSKEDAEANSADFLVKKGEEQIGEGMAINKPKSIGGPARFSPALQAVNWRDIAEGRMSGLVPNESIVGPLVIQHRPVAKPLTPGTMNLEIGDYLRHALREKKIYPAAEIDSLIPKSLTMTLRYGSFGNYYGCSPEIPQPESNDPQPRRLLGVMLILEKID